jgi:hypothetical protein
MIPSSLQLPTTADTYAKKGRDTLKERTKPLADYNDVTLKNKNDKKLSP